MLADQLKWDEEIGAGDPAGAGRRQTDAGVEKLAERAIRGDRKALERLCAEAGRDVLIRARLLHNGDEADIEDIAQESLIKMCENIHTLRDPKAFRSWMNSIVTNETRMYQRKNAGHVRVLCIHEYPTDIPDERQDCLPPECCLKGEETAAVKEIIDTFPPRQREAVVLYYYDGMSVTETAKVMEITQQGVSQYLKLAREKIKREMEPAGADRRRALQMLPAGVMLRQALMQAAGGAAAGDRIWAEAAAKSVPIKAAAKAASGAKAAAVSLKIAGGIAGFAAAGITAAMVLGGGIFPSRPAASADVSVDGVISFNGGEGYVNPTGAAAEAESNYGEMTALRWQITPAGEAGVLYGGEGGAADEALQGMRERGEDGEYIIGFYMKDGEGVTAWLRKRFVVRTE